MKALAKQSDSTHPSPIAASEVRSQAVCLLRGAKRIFVIYSTADLAAACDLRKRIVRLRGKNCRSEDVFLAAQSLPVGKDVTPEVIRAELAAADLAVVVCGTKTPESTFVADEVRQALRQRAADQTKILPIILKSGVKLPKGLDFSIQAVHRTVLFPTIKWISIGVAVVLAMALTAVVVSGWISHLNQRARDQERGAKLASAAQTMLREPVTGGSSPLIAALAVFGWRTAETPDAWNALEQVPLLQKVNEIMLDDFTNGTIVVRHPDGRTVVALDESGTAAICNIVSGTTPAVTIKLTCDSLVRLVVSSADGKTLATASADNIVRLWDSETGKELKRLQSPESITALSFSQNVRWLAAASSNAVTVWALGTNSMKRATARTAPVSHLSVANSGHYVAFQNNRNELELISLNGGPVTGEFVDGPVAAMAFTPDGSALVIAETNGAARILAVRSRDEIARLASPPNLPYQVALSPDGQFLARAGSQDSEYAPLEVQIASVWDGRTAKLEFDHLGLDGLAFTADSHGLEILTHAQSGGGAIEFNELYAFDLGLRHEGHFYSGSNFISAAVTADGKRLAIAGCDRFLRVQQVDGVRIDDQIHGGFINVALSATRNLVARADTNQIHVYRLDNNQELLSVAYEERLLDLSFDSYGSHLYAIDGTGLLQIIPCVAGGVPRKIHLNDWCGEAAFSENGKWLVFEKEGTAQLMQLPEQRLSTTFTWETYEPDFNEPTALVVSPDGKFLAVGQPRGGTLLLMVPSHGESKDPSEPVKARVILRLNDSNVDAMQFSPLGSFFATGSQDGIVRLIQLPTCRELVRISHNSKVSAVAFTTNGKLVTADNRGVVHFWNTDPQDMLHRVSQGPGRNLSQEEWTQSPYLIGLRWQPTFENWPTP